MTNIKCNNRSNSTKVMNPTYNHGASTKHLKQKNGKYEDERMNKFSMKIVNF